MRTPSEVAAAIEAAAKSEGLSMRQVCLRAGVQETTFQRWKRNERRPKYESLLKIQEVLDFQL